MSGPASHPPAPAPESTTAASEGDWSERRGSGKRARARDRLMDRATRPYPQTKAIAKADQVDNLVMFIDDDLRETALAMDRIESYLVRTLGLLERHELDRAEVHALAADREVLEHVDLLNETIESLRRRMARLAASLR